MYAEDREYHVIEPDENPENLRRYWRIAKGLQKVDGLETPPFLDEVAAGNISGEYTVKEAVARVKSYYATDKNAPEKYLEPDTVSAKAVELLAQASFSFSPIMLKFIHSELFDGVLRDDWVGEWRLFDIGKEEPVLGGESVSCAPAALIAGELKQHFAEEKTYSYRIPFTEDQVHHLASFVSAIWKTHPFREGNTRTIAIFTQLYLRELGISVTNEPFAEHADYFRDALVRANYSSLEKGILPEPSFLNKFFENLLRGKQHDLSSDECSLSDQSDPPQ